MAADESEDRIEVAALLNAQCGRIRWPELERHYARGVVVRVADGLDLVDVARQVVADNKAAIEAWLATGRLAAASAADAKRWRAEDTLLWAVVCAPWVLVQDARGSASQDAAGD